MPISIEETAQINIMKILQFVILLATITEIKMDICLPGPFHKRISSKATVEYAACQAYSEDTCCTPEFANEFNRTRLRLLLGFHWGHCKDISKIKYNTD